VTADIFAGDWRVRAHVHALRAAFADAFDELHPDQAIALKELMGHSRVFEVIQILTRREIDERDWGEL